LFAQRRERERLEIETIQEAERQSRKRLSASTTALERHDSYVEEAKEWNATKDDLLVPLREIGWDERWLQIVLTEHLRQIDQSRTGEVVVAELAAALGSQSVGLKLTAQQVDWILRGLSGGDPSTPIAYEPWLEDVQTHVAEVRACSFLQIHSPVPARESPRHG
jgi:hypothetical protein